MAVLVHHRGPTDSSKMSIDFADPFLNLSLHTVVLHDSDARRHDNHQQNDLAVKPGIALQEKLISFETVQNPLGVIEPIDRQRSEERRVGKEGRCRWSAYSKSKKRNGDQR